jgi:hypothetical protein
VLIGIYRLFVKRKPRIDHRVPAYEVLAHKDRGVQMIECESTFLEREVRMRAVPDDGEQDIESVAPLVAHERTIHA